MKGINENWIIYVIIFITVSFSKLQAQPSEDNNQQLVSDYLEKGYSFQIDKQDDLAIIEYNKVLELDNTNHTAYYNLALIYAESKRQLKAIEMADIALINCKEDLQSFYTIKGSCLSDINKFEEALPMFHKALLLDSSDANLHYNLGYTYFKLHKWESAIIYLKEYIEKGEKDKGNYNDALFYIGTCYFSLEKNSEALKYFDLAIELNPYYTYFYNKAETLAILNRDQEALQAINLAIKNNTDKAILYHKRYQILNKLKQITNAYADLKKAFLLDPNDGDILIDMGVMYENENNMEQAIKHYQKCIELKLNLPEAYGNIANIYSGNKLMRESALMYYQKAINEAPKKAGLFFNFGNFYRKTNQIEPAILMYNKAIELDPNLPQPYNNLATIYLGKKNFNKAIDFALEAIKIAPEDFSYNAQLATLYFETKQYQNAISYVTKALQNSPKENKNVDLLNIRGISRQIIGEYKNALYDYLDIVETYTLADRKANSGIFSNIGYCYMEDEQLPNALKYFKEAVSYNLEIDQIIGLFTVQYLMNDKAGFEKNIQKAKSIEPKLNNGYNGILKLEAEGYFYTKKHKLILKKILK